MSNTTLDECDPDWYDGDMYVEQTFQLELKHIDRERRKVARLAEKALRRLAHLRATQQHSSFEDAYREIFDEDLLRHDTKSSDDMLAAAAKAVEHHLGTLSDARFDTWFERTCKPKLPVASPDEIERQRGLRAIIQANADARRARRGKLPGRHLKPV